MQKRRIPSRKIATKTLSKLKREIWSLIQESPKAQNKINSNRGTPRHVAIKLSRTKLKQTPKKQQDKSRNKHKRLELSTENFSTNETL